MKQHIIGKRIAGVLLAAALVCPGAAWAAETEMQGGPESALAHGAAVAEASDMAAPVELDLGNLEAIEADQLNDGSYSIDVECSSSMFRIVECSLNVQNGSMEAVLTMSGTSYLFVYPGTGEEAADAEEQDYIPFVVDEKGSHTFTIPVASLNTPQALAAFSKNKEMWYDRTLVFLASSLPKEAFREGVLPAAATVDLPDGTYFAEVALEGGSGRASVESPALLTAEGGQITARIIWSSKNYDYMKVDDVKYDRLNSEGNSVFEIPVAGFDVPLPVIADTTAMSVPHEIDYTLCFDSSTIAEAE